MICCRYGVLIDPFQWIQMGLKEPYSWPNVALIPRKYLKYATIKFLNFRMQENFAEISLKFK